MISIIKPATRKPGLKVLLSAAAALIFVLSGCAKPVADSVDDESTHTAETPILYDALKVASALGSQDMGVLAAYVNPDQGLRFSPYGYINTKTDQIFTQKQVASLLDDSQIYNWGIYDGSGEPIELAFSSYFERFIWDRDYLSAETIGNNHAVGQGNMQVNVAETYPDGKFVEFHFPGTQDGGIDWSSLRLIFQEKNGLRWLVGISHDQWTI